MSDKRVAELENEYNCILTPNKQGDCFKIHRPDGMMMWFEGLPSCMPLDDIETVLPQLDKTFPDWRKDDE